MQRSMAEPLSMPEAPKPPKGERLKNKIVLLTGAAQGIGEAIVASFAIAPGYIETQLNLDYWNGFADPHAERQRALDLHPPKRIGQPIEVAMTAVFLASDEAPFINASCITIDGGRSVMYHD